MNRACLESDLCSPLSRSLLRTNIWAGAFAPGFGRRHRQACVCQLTFLFVVGYDNNNTHWGDPKINSGGFTPQRSCLNNNVHFELGHFLWALHNTTFCCEAETPVLKRSWGRITHADTTKFRIQFERGPPPPPAFGRVFVVVVYLISSLDKHEQLCPAESRALAPRETFVVRGGFAVFVSMYSYVLCMCSVCCCGSLSTNISPFVAEAANRNRT